MTITDRTLLDRLVALKQTGVGWESAWAFATGGNRQKYFQPTDRDDGTTKPPDRIQHVMAATGDVGEPFKRFVYRSYRAAYLGLPTAPDVALHTVRDLSDRDTTMGRPSRPGQGKGAMAA